MKRNSFFGKAFLMFIIFCAFTAVVAAVDVQPIGPDNSCVGLACVNSYVRNLFPFNNIFYGMSQVLGYIGVAVMICFAFTGFIQLVKRKKIFSVDPEILSLGVIYIGFAVLYLFFNKVLVINYRPYIISGELSSSYPSSHTLMAFVVFTTTAVIAGRKKCSFVKICALILAVLTVLFRMLSGVHWFTDIIGAILISSVFVFLFVGLINLKK